MPHHLDARHGELLVQLAASLRPDWNPASLRTVLQAANPLPGDDWEHVVRALLAYATARKPDGAWAKLTPRFFTEAGGTHWTTTRTMTGPREYVKVPACEDHPEQEAATCRCCWADVKVGERPTEGIGRRTPEGGWGKKPSQEPRDAARSDEWVWAGESPSGAVNPSQIGS